MVYHKTHKMGVKCDLFVEYKHDNSNGDIGNCQQEQVMSEMITFDCI